MTPTCRWIKKAATKDSPGIYCGKKVRWTTVEDGGEPGAPLVRKYNPFCDYHMEMSD